MQQELNQSDVADVGGNQPPQGDVGAGAVNFESNLISTSEARATAEVEASPPVVAHVSLGNVQVVPAPAAVVARVAEPELVHTLTASINVTLNTCFTLLKGMKELKTVDIETAGETVKYNFYNPFVRADKDRQTGEGLLRKTFGSIATFVHNTAGQEVRSLGSEDEMESRVERLTATMQDKLLKQFPLTPDRPLFDMEVELAEGVTVKRPVLFGELFSLTSWVSVTPPDASCIVVHTVNINIGLNIGAMYDAKEPITFIRQAMKFMDNHLQAVGIADVIDYHLNYAIDASSMADPDVRDVFETLLAEDGYSVVSKSGVESSKYDWIPAKSSTSLFGFGCDLILRSPIPELEEEEEPAED